MIPCQICHRKLQTIIEYNKHIKIHRHFTNFQVNCIYSGCNTKCTSYNSYAKHQLRFHCDSDDDHYTCKHLFCNARFSNLRSLKKHYNLHNLNSKNACTLCASKTFFITRNALRVHVTRFHSQRYVHDETQVDEHRDVNVVNNQLVQNVQTTLSNTFEKESIDIPNSTTEVTSQSKDVNNRLAELYLNLSTKYLASEPLIRDVVESFSYTLNTCKEYFFTSLNTSNIGETDKKSVADIFNNCFETIINNHDSKTGIFRSTYSRKQFYRNSFKYIQPKEISLYNKQGKETNCRYSYVPILKTLENMLQNNNVIKHCIKCDTQKSSNGVFDIKDGTVFQKNQFFKNEINNIQLILYQDAFECCNPIGMSKGKFKEVGVYMMLANLPTYLRSRVEYIKLVLLCRNKFIRQFSWAEVMKELIKDLKILESDGISVSLPDGIITLKGSVVVVLGDNLGSHEIGGFVENFSTNQNFCRYCTKSLKDLRNNIFDDKPMRTVESYKTCVTEAMITKKPVQGIKSDSPLNTLQYFHVCNPGLPPCLAHDLFEGVAQFDMWLAIHYFIKKKWFKIGLLNYRLNNISLSGEYIQSIPEIKMSNKNKKLIGSASKIRHLLLLFPLVVADRIKDFDDPVWRMVLHLRQIATIVCAPALAFGQIALLKSEINDFVTLRRQCFPTVKLRPKHEFLFHYAELIYFFGPLKHVWTLRCESKHKYFKSIIKTSQNYKNVSQMLAEKHEMQQCSQKYPYEILFEIENPVDYKSQTYKEDVHFVISEFCKNNDCNVKYSSNKVSFRGIQYRKDQSICVEKNEYGHLIACKIEVMLVTNDYTQLYFVGRTFQIILNTDLGVYENVQYKGDENRSRWLTVFSHSSLLSADPLLESHIKSIPVYLMKYVPFDEDM